MNRIFLSLGVLTLAFLGGTFCFGLLLGDIREHLDEATRKMVRLHFFAGVFSSLWVILVQSIVVTWFIGTSRWCKEVVETYRLPSDLALRSAVHKRKAFPLALVGMLAIVGVAALGAASDPGAAFQPAPLEGAPAWATFHQLAALLTMGWLAFAFFVEWQEIQANSEVIAEIMTHVRRIRQERGLDVEDEAGVVRERE